MNRSPFPVPDGLQLDRRSLMLGAAGLGLASATGGVTIAPTQATAASTLKQVPYFYRFRIGAHTGTVVSDGILPLGDPTGSFNGPSPDELRAMLTRNFLPTDNSILEQNALVLDAGDQRILFDTGMGTSQLFGPTTGQLQSSLSAAGIEPSSITAIVCTHGHCDHVWGIMSDAGERLFPNAQIWISQADFDFWTDEAKLSIKDPAWMAGFVEGARRNLMPNQDRMKFFKDGEEFLPGLQAMFTPGHTVGHTSFIITSGKDSMMLIGDLTHHHVILLEKPLTQFAFDTDPALSAQNRVRALDMIAAQRLPIIAYHFPWPGIGNVEKVGQGFRYHPAPMIMQEIPT